MSVKWVEPSHCADTTAAVIAKTIGRPHPRKPRAYRVAAYASGMLAVIPEGHGRHLKPRNVIGTYAPTDNLFVLSRVIAGDLQA